MTAARVQPVLATALALGLSLATPARAGLQVCGTDTFDPNDDCATAVVTTPGSYPALSVATTPADNDWYKIWLQRNGTLTIDLAFTHASGDIDMRLFDNCGGIQVGISQGTVNSEHISYKNSGTSRYYYLRVYDVTAANCNSYSMNLAITSADDIDVTYTPPGWALPLVPSNVNTATLGSVPLPATLTGNTLGTWFNAATNITGPDVTPAFDAAVSLDDTLLQNFNYSDGSAPMLWSALNAGPYVVRGGRHTLRHDTDIHDAMVETNESDNTWAAQWVWSPLVTAYDTPNVRGLPPLKGTGTYRNADGTTFDRNGGMAWVVAEAPLTAGDDYDLRVYSDYAGISSGYSTLIGSSQAAGNATDLVVGHYLSTPTTLYPAVDRFLAGTGGVYALDQGDARSKQGNFSIGTSFSWKPMSLPAWRLADVYEGNLTAGVTYYFTLRLLTGTTPLGFRVYPGTTGGVYGVTGGTAGVGSSWFQTLSFTASVTGWHPIVVYRKSGTDAGTPATYDFEWSSTGLVGVGGPDGVHDLALAGAVPNPIRDRGVISFTLPDAGPVSLGIYDVNGRLVRQLTEGVEGAGVHTIAWDGARADGGHAAAGVYWARLRFGERTLARRVAVLP